MHEPFWPTLPFLIPKSEGLPLWWTISWWIFQIVIMTVLLLVVGRWAIQVERTLHGSVGQPTGAQADEGQSLDS